MAARERKEEFGYTYEFFSDGMPQIGLGPFWKNTKGNVVLIFPPYARRTHWVVWSVLLPFDAEVIIGNDAESRCFAIAQGYARQDVGER